MTSVEPDAGGLADLRVRLRGGVYPAVEAGRPADFSFRDQEAFRHWPDDLAGSLEHVRDDAWSRSGQPHEIITKLAGRMRKQRDLLAVVVFSPHLVLNRLLQLCGSSGQGLVDTWIGMCWVARREWRDFLDSYQSHPLLSQAKPNELEQELRALVFPQYPADAERATSPASRLVSRAFGRTFPADDRR